MKYMSIPLTSNLSRTDILEILGLPEVLFTFSFLSLSSLIFFERVIISYYKKETVFSKTSAQQYPFTF